MLYSIRRLSIATLRQTCLNELRFLRHLRHPNIVGFYGAPSSLMITIVITVIMIIIVVTITCTIVKYYY